MNASVASAHPVGAPGSTADPGLLVAPGLPRPDRRSDHAFAVVTGGHRRPALGPSPPLSPVVEGAQRLRSDRSARSVHVGRAALAVLAVLAHSIRAAPGPGRDRARPAESFGRRGEGLRRAAGAAGDERRLSSVPRRGHLPVRAHLERRRSLRRVGDARATPPAIDDGCRGVSCHDGRLVHAVPRHALGHRRSRRLDGRRSGAAGHTTGLGLGHCARRDVAQMAPGPLASRLDT